MNLNLKTGILKQIASALGLDPKTLLREEAQRLARQQMEPSIPKIAAKMRADGWTLAGRGEGPVIRDALFRLWREVFHFSGGGRVADLVRDSHDDEIIAQLAAPVTPETSLEDLVRMTMEATLELAF
ncbi:MAG: hypothetical protein ACO1SX_23145 [Actinomycetota bacterium]